MWITACELVPLWYHVSMVKIHSRTLRLTTKRKKKVEQRYKLMKKAGTARSQQDVLNWLIDTYL